MPPAGIQAHVCEGNGSQGSDQVEKNIFFKTHIHSQEKSLDYTSEETPEKQFRSLL